MTKRALIIGSQTGGLTGVYTDVNAVAERLEEWGFQNELCLGAEATRQGILERYSDLIDRTETGDAAVVYYSGHGGLAVNPAYQPTNEPGPVGQRYFQFIVPTDIDRSTESDFRGIMSIELSVLLAQLTTKTKNATVILDCCHSARMSRDLDLVPRALPRPWYIGVLTHLEKLAQQNLATDGRHPEGNPDAVRLVACAPTESAYEYTNSAGQRHGLLTESFLIALAEAKGLQVSWHSVGTRVRERVLSVVSYQRPEVEGPSDRLLFDLEEVDRTGVLPVTVQQATPVLQGGRLLGVTVGDEYTIMPFGYERPDPKEAVGLATVESVTGSTAQIRIDFREGHSSIPEGANAFPRASVLPRWPVRVTAPHEQAEDLQQQINRSDRVCVSGDEDAADILAEIVVADGQIHLCDRSGRSIITPKAYDDLGITVTVKNLERLARARDLRRLRSGVGAEALSTPYQIEWGRVVDGKAHPLDHAGELVFTGQPVYIRVVNEGARTIYCSLFDIGLSGNITLLNAAEPSGIELQPGWDYVYGHKEGVGLTGMNVSWPAGVPNDVARDESLVAIISDAPQDLRALEQRGVRTAVGPLLPRSGLQRLMEQAAVGGKRDLTANQGEDLVRYAVSQITFQLSPEAMHLQDEGTFLIDERPDAAFLLGLPQPRGRVPANIAIRLKDLIVRSNRALGSTPIRVDSLIVTDAYAPDGSRLFQAETRCFDRIKDGDRLPFDNLLIYHGPAASFVDMAIWVSRDQRDSLSLADMLNAQLNSTEFKTAATLLGGLAMTAPQAAVAAAAVGAGATLIGMGYKLLLHATGKSIGLYRTSHLALEQFGVGRHPSRDLMSVQDLALSYEIVDLDAEPAPIAIA